MPPLNAILWTIAGVLVCLVAIAWLIANVSVTGT